ncbi:hypothetical protein [Roseibium sediminis]|uniref:hypothetical protein n=1 Tax=Roseibium sediminis TaxID=1775174 RepID=UPI00123E3D85|nr:hypothetical protein [Roseibium sediminis]
MSWIASKEEIQKEAEEYSKLGFLDKSKNVLVLIVLVKTVLALMFFPVSEELIYNLGAYWLLAALVFMNLRFAIAALFALFMVDAVLTVISGRVPILLLIFSIFVAIFSRQSFLVASELKRKSKAASVTEKA